MQEEIFIRRNGGMSHVMSKVSAAKAVLNGIEKRKEYIKAGNTYDLIIDVPASLADHTRTIKVVKPCLCLGAYDNYALFEYTSDRTGYKRRVGFLYIDIPFTEDSEFEKLCQDYNSEED